MAGSSLTVGKRTDGRTAHRSLRSELAHAYAATFGRTARCDTLDGLEAIVSWARRCERRDGVNIFRSMPQVFRGVGWRTTGKIRADRDAHHNRLRNWLNMLQAMGVLEWESHFKANGEGRGILISLRRDSSVGGAILAAARSSPSRRVSPPLRGRGPSNRSKLCVVVEE